MPERDAPKKPKALERLLSQLPERPPGVVLARPPEESPVKPPEAPAPDLKVEPAPVVVEPKVAAATAAEEQKLKEIERLKREIADMDPATPEPAKEGLTGEQITTLDRLHQGYLDRYQEVLGIYEQLEKISGALTDRDRINMDSWKRSKANREAISVGRYEGSAYKKVLEEYQHQLPNLARFLDSLKSKKDDMEKKLVASAPESAVVPPSVAKVPELELRPSIEQELTVVLPPEGRSVDMIRKEIDEAVKRMVAIKNQAVDQMWAAKTIDQVSGIGRNAIDNLRNNTGIEERTLKRRIENLSIELKAAGRASEISDLREIGNISQTELSEALQVLEERLNLVLQTTIESIQRVSEKQRLGTKPNAEPVVEPAAPPAPETKVTELLQEISGVEAQIRELDGQIGAFLDKLHIQNFLLAERLTSTIETIPPLGSLQGKLESELGDILAARMGLVSALQKNLADIRVVHPPLRRRPAPELLPAVAPSEGTLAPELAPVTPEETVEVEADAVAQVERLIDEVKKQIKDIADKAVADAAAAKTRHAALGIRRSARDIIIKVGGLARKDLDNKVSKIRRTVGQAGRSEEAKRILDMGVHNLMLNFQTEQRERIENFEWKYQVPGRAPEVRPATPPVTRAPEPKVARPEDDPEYKKVYALWEQALANAGQELRNREQARDDLKSRGGDQRAIDKLENTIGELTSVFEGLNNRFARWAKNPTPDNQKFLDSTLEVYGARWAKAKKAGAKLEVRPVVAEPAPAGSPETEKLPDDPVAEVKKWAEEIKDKIKTAVEQLKTDLKKIKTLEKAREAGNAVVARLEKGGELYVAREQISYRIRKMVVALWGAGRKTEVRDVQDLNVNNLLLNFAVEQEEEARKAFDLWCRENGEEFWARPVVAEPKPPPSSREPAPPAATPVTKAPGEAVVPPVVSPAETVPPTPARPEGDQEHYRDTLQLWERTIQDVKAELENRQRILADLIKNKRSAAAIAKYKKDVGTLQAVFLRLSESLAVWNKTRLVGDEKALYEASTIYGKMWKRVREARLAAVTPEPATKIPEAKAPDAKKEGLTPEQRAELNRLRQELTTKCQEMFSLYEELKAIDPELVKKEKENMDSWQSIRDGKIYGGEVYDSAVYFYRTSIGQIERNLKFFKSVKKNVEWRQALEGIQDEIEEKRLLLDAARDPSSGKTPADIAKLEDELEALEIDLVEFQGGKAEVLATIAVSEPERIKRWAELRHAREARAHADTQQVEAERKTRETQEARSRVEGLYRQYQAVMAEMRGLYSKAGLPEENPYADEYSGWANSTGVENAWQKNQDKPESYFGLEGLINGQLRDLNRFCDKLRQEINHQKDPFRLQETEKRIENLTRRIDEQLSALRTLDDALATELTTTRPPVDPARRDIFMLLRDEILQELNWRRRCAERLQDYLRTITQRRLEAEITALNPSTEVTGPAPGEAPTAEQVKQREKEQRDLLEKKERTIKELRSELQGVERQITREQIMASLLLVRLRKKDQVIADQLEEEIYRVRPSAVSGPVSGEALVSKIVERKQVLTNLLERNLGKFLYHGERAGAWSADFADSFKFGWEPDDGEGPKALEPKAPIRALKATGRGIGMVVGGAVEGLGWGVSGLAGVAKGIWNFKKKRHQRQEMIGQIMKPLQGIFDAEYLKHRDNPRAELKLELTPALRASLEASGLDEEDWVQLQTVLKKLPVDKLSARDYFIGQVAHHWYHPIKWYKEGKVGRTVHTALKQRVNDSLKRHDLKELLGKRNISSENKLSAIKEICELKGGRATIDGVRYGVNRYGRLFVSLDDEPRDVKVTPANLGAIIDGYGFYASQTPDELDMSPEDYNKDKAEARQRIKEAEWEPLADKKLSYSKRIAPLRLRFGRGIKGVLRNVEFEHRDDGIYFGPIGLSEDKKKVTPYNLDAIVRYGESTQVLLNSSSAELTADKLQEAARSAEAIL